MSNVGVPDTGTKVFSEIIAKSRYARWIDEQERRENYDETVNRWFSFWENKLPELVDKKGAGELLSSKQWKLAKEYVNNLLVLPSMRGLMSAGPALDKNAIGQYNCAFDGVDHPKAFSEALYILMHGTGYGFSVEEKFVSKLPTIPEDFYYTTDIFVIEDSKEGWRDAYDHLITSLYAGVVPIFDFSKIRKKGERLKTFGGRASGPEPLAELFAFTVGLFLNNRGRQLQSIHAHDLLCMTGVIVTCGGVRRSAEISLSDLGDFVMSQAKTGNWWAPGNSSHRALANNSAVYEEKPSFEEFQKEWQALYSSYSGERGIFSRYGAVNQIKRNGRRKWEGYIFGTNPCFSGDSLLLTSDGYKTFESLEGQTVEIINPDGEVDQAEVYLSGYKEWVEVHFENQSLMPICCTPNHLLYTYDGNAVEAALSEGEELKRFGRQIKGCTVAKVVRKSNKIPVFDFTTSGSKKGVVNGFVVHNCGEILLRPGEFCNLSEAVVRPEDTWQSLAVKVELATIIGTIQSSYTYFPKLRDKWKNNCDEERLLGVSLTGVFDNPMMFDISTPEKREELQQQLQNLKELAVKTNKYWAAKLGIPQSAAVTCIKPSGTVSSLVNSAAGLHARYAPYYIRRITGDAKDPLTEFLKTQLPWEPNNRGAGDPNSVIFSFPMKAPDNALVTKDLDPIYHLEIWKIYSHFWCEHNPSVTVNYTDENFEEVGQWVYDNFDDLCGVSFLPYDGSVYVQAPYEEITKEQYEELVKDIPDSIDWTLLAEYEKEDMTTGSQELACVAGSCDFSSI